MRSSSGALDELGRGDNGRLPGDLAFARISVGGSSGRSRRLPRRRWRSRAPGAPPSRSSRTTAPYTYAGRLGDQRRTRRVVRPRARSRRAESTPCPRPPAFPFAAARGARPVRAPAVHDVERMVIRCDAPMPLQVDGEDLGDVEQARFEAEPNAVTVLVPAGGLALASCPWRRRGRTSDGRSPWRTGSRASGSARRGCLERVVVRPRIAASCRRWTSSVCLS